MSEAPATFALSEGRQFLSVIVAVNPHQRMLDDLCQAVSRSARIVRAEWAVQTQPVR